ncbi:hypothetical protein SMSP1_02215 [Sedimentisphaera salicampi]|nr:hypothetical protein SMSP1_02215 [Sedimentisphaera salicampi]
MLQNETLKSIFHKRFTLDIKISQGNNTAVLRETGQDAILKKVKLSNIPQNAVILKMDACKCPEYIFRTTKDHNKRCDYLLIYQKSEEPVPQLVFIELKSRKLKGIKISNQFISSVCLFDYINSILMNFYEIKALSETKRHFILLHKKRIAKSKTRKKRKHFSTSESCPERPLSINPSNSPILFDNIRISV